jgi:hypothetical protein
MNYIQVCRPPSDDCKSTGASQTRVVAIIPPSQEPTNLVVVDSLEAVMLRSHKAITLEQQPSPMKRGEDRKDPTCRHMKIDERRLDPKQIHHRQRPTKSNWIHRRHASTRPSTMLDAPPGHMLDKENLIPSLGSRRRHAFLCRT